MYRKGLTFLCLLLVPCAPGITEDKQYDRERRVRDGRMLVVNISRQFSETGRQNTVEWTTAISDSLHSVYGRWPRRQWEIRVSPAPARGDDPIPWAEVKRGEVDRIDFYTAAGATAAELKRAWTGYHEVAHLLIPYQGYGDAWFSEGLASYYQNILQARGGILDEREMWQKLYEGYQRGLADSRFADKTLREASDQMRREGGFMRVYWSGAWYFLAADTRLRQQSRGALTLDLALEKLNACCADESLSVPQMVRKLDDLNRVLLFQPLYDQLVKTRAVPSFDSIFASLGISVRAGEVQLQDRGPGIGIRRGIALGATAARDGL
jgi:hypothetical protein